MHALNIMWGLNEVDCNTHIEIKYFRSKSCDWIEIETDKFSFSITEYGDCSLCCNGNTSKEKDVEYWGKVKTWVSKYFQEVL